MNDRDFGKGDILVVDDTPANLQVLAGMLKERGYKVRPAPNGRLALQAARGERPDLILLDITMPDMSGYEVCEKLKEDEALRDIPVIFISALSETLDKVKAFAVGGLDYITKPFQMEEVLARVDTHLKLHRLQRELELNNHRLEEINRALVLEREKTNQLLLNILPASVAEDLKHTGFTAPELFPDVTVMFSDFVNFTGLSMLMEPADLIRELNELFTAFDDIVERYKCERIKTIGDAYLAVSGMPLADPEHAAKMVKIARDMLDFLDRRNANSAFKWEARIGIHSGPAVGAVVGVKKYLYDVFGDTINTASRMENLSAPQRINLSDATYQLVKDHVKVEPRELTEVKGKGRFQMYFVL